MTNSMNRADSFKCRTIRSLGPDLAESDRLPATLAEHSSTCLRCQAEVARYRRLRRELDSLGNENVAAPDTILPAVEMAIAAELEPETRPTSRVVATVAGATAARSGRSPRR